MKMERKKDEENKQKNKKKKNDKILISVLSTLAIILVIGVLTIYYYTTAGDKKDEKTLAYTELLNEINNNNVEKIEMTVGSTSVKVKLKDIEEEKTAIIPSTDVFMELIKDKIIKTEDT